MNPDVKQEWVAELRAGKYHQIKGALHNGNGYRCALGVLVDVFIKYHPGKALWSWENGYVLKCDDGTGKWITHKSSNLPNVVAKWAHTTTNPTFRLPIEDKKNIPAPTLIAANDSKGESFSRIADRIEFGREV